MYQFLVKKGKKNRPKRYGVILFFLLSSLFFLAESSEKTPLLTHFPACERIITLSPALTELMVESGLESQLVGHSAFSPPLSNQSSLEVGSLYNLNLEVVYRLAPTVIFSEAVRDSKTLEELKKLGLPVVLIPLQTLEDILESPKRVAHFCQPLLAKEKELQAHYLKRAEEFRNWLDSHQNSLALFKNLLIFYGDGLDHYQNRAPSLVAGMSVHQELVESMGGNYAYQGELGAFTLNEEGLFQLDPEVIIIINPSSNDRSLHYGAIKVFWPRLTGLSAVKKETVFLIEGPKILLPTLDTLWQLAILLEAIED